jgi:hypothetical protein
MPHDFLRELSLSMISLPEQMGACRLAILALKTEVAFEVR